MRNSKFGLRAFGLALVAALGLMAFMAVAAQAETALENGGEPANFLVNKETALAKLGVTFEFNQEGTGTLLVPGRLDILCTSGNVTGEFLDKTNEALGKATFTGCTAWSPVSTFPHVTKLPCTVSTAKTGGELEKVIVTKALALSKLHEKAPYVLLEEDGAIFTTIFLQGAECPVTPENKVTGSVVGKVVVATNDTTEPLIEFSQAIQKLFQVGEKGDHLKFGTFEAYIDASAKGKLTDTAHKGLTLGVC